MKDEIIKELQKLIDKIRVPKIYYKRYTYWERQEYKKRFGRIK